MTPADEAEFIALWQEGASYRELAQAFDCPLGTVASRSAALAAQGKITPRPRGGVKARQEGSPAPAQAPAPPPADAALPTRDPPAITFLAVPEVRELIHTVTDLVARVSTLEAGTREATRIPPAPASPPAPARVDIEQWTVRLSKALIERIKAEAAAAQKPPSHLLEELAWHALNDRRSLTS